MTNHISTFLLRLACIALLFSSLVAWLFFPAVYTTQRSLEPYYTVVTPLPHAEAVQRLESGGVTDLIAPETTLVHVSRVGRVEEVSLAQAYAQLDELDPRRDSYMDGLWNYFRQGEQNVLLARIDANAWRANRIVRQVLGPASSVAERGELLAVISLIFFTASSVAVVLVAREGRLVSVLVALPFVPAVFFFGIPLLVVAAGTVVVSAWYLDGSKARRARRLPGLGLIGVGNGRRLAWLSAAVALGLVYLVVAAGARAGVAYTVSVFGACAGVVLYLYRPKLRDLDEGHQLFRPVPMLTQTAFFARSRAWATLAVVLVSALGVTPFALELMLRGEDEVRMVAVPAAEEYSMEALAGLYAARGSGELPTIADYLAHRAYQEGFGYDVEYAFPTRHGIVEITRIRREADGTLSTYSDPVLRFDESWLEGALATAPAGVATLLASFAQPVGVVLAPVEPVYSGYSPTLLHVLFALILLLPFVPALVPSRRSRPQAATEMLMKRGSQVANA
ncbi:MAG: hypothetical protein ACLFNT_09605 [Spirochaetales bacterium]